MSSFSFDKLGALLNLPIEIIRGIAEEAPFLYRNVKIPQKNKPFRELEIPHPALKLLQKRILHGLFDNITLHPSLYGGPGSSVKKATYTHLRKPVVITLDIKNFFPNIKPRRINNAFKLLGFEEKLAVTLTRLITCHNCLPQGAPTSPFIGRLVLNQFAYAMGELITGIHSRAAFSIYVDDIIISGPKGIIRIVPLVGKILRHNGLRLNLEKTRIMYRSDEQVALNIRLNNKIEASKKFLVEVENVEKQLPPWHPRLKGMRAYLKYLASPML